MTPDVPGGAGFEFSDGETSALADLKATLKQVAEWPPDSPLAFVLMLAPRTRGKLGEMLLAQIAENAGLIVGKAESVAYDVRIGAARCEVKFSTEDPPRFQQVRDPREASATKYDYLVCISGRPHGLVYWLIPAEALGQLMDGGAITVQHAMSDTKWFLPSRTESDVFASFRFVYEDFLSALAAIAA
jgi:diadenosine tetraphosphatase ApaH/serine/threonine PP2A family protein phosphatase